MTLPAKITLVSPIGTISSYPTFVWNEDASYSLGYDLWIETINGFVVSKWYWNYDLVHGSGTYSIVPSIQFSGGHYKWWVRGWNPTGGYGPWSDEGDFYLPTGVSTPTTKVSPPSAYFLYPIDWSVHPKIKRGWVTNILSGITGNEQRSKLKNNISRTLSLTMTTKDEEMSRHLKGNMFLYQSEIWGVIVHPYRMKLSQLHVIGDTTLIVDSTVGCELSTFTYLMIGNWKAYEICYIRSYTENTIVIDQSIDFWAAGTFAYPVMICVLSDIQQFTNMTPFNFKGEYTFVEQVNWESI